VVAAPAFLAQGDTWAFRWRAANTAWYHWT